MNIELMTFFYYTKAMEKRWEVKTGDLVLPITARQEADVL
jgi:hypothetical protein